MYSFLSSDLFLLTLTIGVYCAATAAYRRFHYAFLHPVLITFLSMILVLKSTSIDYERYRQATEILNFALGLSVVALGYLLYEQAAQMRGRLIPIFTSTFLGCIVGILSVIYIARLLGADRTLLTSIAPKSVTMPIAVAVAEPLGGIIPITSVVVFAVGIFGSIAGPWILKKCGVHDNLARGFALGSAAHGIGTARAIELGAVEGALSGLAMALMGLITALLMPIIEKYLY
ncbi:MAG: LrgB family protein [Alistipes sp.]